MWFRVGIGVKSIGLEASDVRDWVTLGFDLWALGFGLWLGHWGSDFRVPPWCGIAGA